MKTNRTNLKPTATTYALLVGSEENERSAYETFVYALLIGAAAFSVWFAAHQPFRVPVASATNGAAVVAQAMPAAHPDRA